MITNPTARRFRGVLVLGSALLLGGGLGLAQQPAAKPASGGTAASPSVPVDEIVQKFAAKESEFKRARDNYTYRQTVRVLELDDDGRERGRYEMVSDIIFTPSGKRLERVVRAPMPTLHNISLDPGDEQDLRNVQPFVLTAEEISKYIVTYSGPQKVDEIETYVFTVKPKAMQPGQRYFDGQIWVDQQDLQIVKSFGQGVQKKSTTSRYPRFETYRDQIDGKYWFPVYTRADDVLHFQTSDQRVRMTVKYEDYKQFKSQVGIEYEGVVNDKQPESNKKQPESNKKK
jgi:hypothetical protein